MNQEYKIRVLRTFNELEEIHDFWQAMVRHPNTDYDFYATIVRSRPEVQGPAVFVLYHFTTPVAMLIGRIEEAPMDVKFGYVTLPTPRLRQLVLLYGGVCGEVTDLAAKLFFREIKALLKQKVVDAVVFNYLPRDSNLFTAMTNQIPFGCRDHVLLPNPHWSTRLPKTLDEFMNKIAKNHRYGIRRQAKILEAAFPNEVEVLCLTKDGEVQKLCTDSERIAGKTYQRSLGVLALDSREMLERLSVHARSGSLRGYVLYIRKEPCAFWIGTLYKGVFFMDFTGYDTRYQTFAIGTYLFMKLIEDLCRNTTASSLDFGFGDAVYKKKFGDTSWPEMTVMLFPATVKGITLNALRQTTALLTLGITRVFSNRFLQAVKTRWRKQRAEKLKNEPAQVNA